MAKNLVIVESPAKVKTIKKFIGTGYEVMASMGHVRDLPKSTIGIDVEHDFDPHYITIRGKGELLAALRKAAKAADTVYLATDPDREGEAISWHLIAALGLEGKRCRRISFNEITKTAVKAAIKAPRDIDMNLVDAQQARRVIDRLVGYRISPVLWEKVKRGLSAGRVQSVALRMIADREEEIAAFIPAEYWTIEADYALPSGKGVLTARYFGRDRKENPENKEAAERVTSELTGTGTVREVKRGERIRRAPLPFTTSTLQQEASKLLNFPTQKTMRIAQQLYEGVDIKGSGTVGIITYLRTDSTRIADEAEKAAASYIAEEYGNAFLGSHEKEGHGKNVQDAHEAIRPTDIRRTPAQIKESLTRDQFRLYQLIWKRFTASRMADAVYETQQISIADAGHVFHVAGSKLRFQGFLSVYPQAEDEESEKADIISAPLAAGDRLTMKDVRPEQHFTQPPAHFTEASLVRAMEERGIGRPSTYAPTISTILGRHYVVREQKNLFMTELGEAVNHIMIEAFPTIVDEGFTASLETLFDGIAEGTCEWKTVVRNFYPDLEVLVNSAREKLSKVSIQDEVTDEICEVCGRHMVLKYGPHGKFLACPGFPECRNTRPYFEKTGIVCPLCGKDVVLRRTRKGRRYYGCIDNPACSFMSWQKPGSGKAAETADEIDETL